MLNNAVSDDSHWVWVSVLKLTICCVCAKCFAPLPCFIIATTLWVDTILSMQVRKMKLHLEHTASKGWSQDSSLGGSTRLHCLHSFLLSWTTSPTATPSPRPLDETSPSVRIPFIVFMTPRVMQRRQSWPSPWISGFTGIMSTRLWGSILTKAYVRCKTLSPCYNAAMSLFCSAPSP